MDWSCGLSSSAPALQAPKPEFKPSLIKKKKKKVAFKLEK
jgi:hypothetical protein